MTKRPPIIWVTPDGEIYDYEEYTSLPEDAKYVRCDHILDALIKSGEYDIKIEVKCLKP